MVLIFGIRKDFWNAFTILFHLFCSAKDFQAAILTDANGNENRNVLDFAASAAFQVDTIYVDIRIGFGKRAGTLNFDIEMMEAEGDNHPGHEKSERSDNDD